MRILVTGVSGFVGARLVPRLARDGHELRGFVRDPARVAPGLEIPLVVGDALTGAGPRGRARRDRRRLLPDPCDGAGRGRHGHRRLPSARAGSGGAIRRGSTQRRRVSRVVYLGGLVPQGAPALAHLASRLAVEQMLLDAVPGSVALRASIVIGAGSRSFRFLVRLVERLPLLALPVMARASHPADRRARRRSSCSRAPRPRRRGRRSLARRRRPGRRQLRRADRADPRRTAAATPAAGARRAHADPDRSSRAGSPRRSPASATSWSGR